MTTIEARQPSGADVRRSYPNFHLIIDEAPATAQGVIGQKLINAGTLNVAGKYRCNIATYDWQNVEVVLKPSSLAGTFAPRLVRHYLDNVGERTVVTGSNFVDDTLQSLTFASDLNGTIKASVDFTIPGGGSISFAPGAAAATPGAVAEYNGY